MNFNLNKVSIRLKKWSFWKRREEIILLVTFNVIAEIVL